MRADLLHAIARSVITACAVALGVWATRQEAPYTAFLAFAFAFYSGGIASLAISDTWRTWRRR
jgi:hypothetical protein